MSAAALVTNLRRLGFDLQFNDECELIQVSVPVNKEGFAFAMVRWDEIIQITYEDWHKI
jgi:hypothetical protein